MRVCDVVNKIPCCLDLLSGARNIRTGMSQLFFTRHNRLGQRCSELCSSLFQGSRVCVEIVRALTGYGRNVAHGRVSARLGLGSNKALAGILQRLVGYSFMENCGAHRGGVGRGSRVCRLASLCALFCVSFYRPNAASMTC